MLLSFEFTIIYLKNTIDQANVEYRLKKSLDKRIGLRENRPPYGEGRRDKAQG